MHTRVAHSHTHVVMYRAALFILLFPGYILIHHWPLIEDNFFLFLWFLAISLLLQRIEPESVQWS
jgi:hypothetical protein